MSVYDSPDWYAFVRSVRAAPDDDLPRVVAADWLDEHGEPARAELIRLQCERAGMLHECTGHRGHQWRPAHWQCHQCDYCRVVDRERELLPKNPAVLADTSRFGKAMAAFTRGFADRFELTAELWLEYGDRLVRREPVREVRLTTRPRWTRDTKYGDGYARLIGRDKCESIGCIIGNPDDGPLQGKLLIAEWPGVRFALPGYLGYDWADPRSATNVSHDDFAGQHMRQ